MKRAVAVRHVAFEDLGLLSGVLQAGAYSPAYADAGVDTLGDIRLDQDDVLVVLGGPISAFDDERYPFLVDELRLIEQCLRRRVPVLGICLGAQLVARALGVSVYPGIVKEIGFASVQLTVEGRSSCLGHLEQAMSPVLHWHGDTFDLPVGAVRLAVTSATPNQAFSMGKRVLALQFHIEVDPAQFERWLVGHTGELTAEHIDVPTLRADAGRHAAAIASSGRTILQAWLDGLRTA